MVDPTMVDATHVRFFTSKSFKRLLSDSGFGVVAFTRSGRSRPSRIAAAVLPIAGEFVQSQLLFLARPR